MGSLSLARSLLPCLLLCSPLGKQKGFLIPARPCSKGIPALTAFIGHRFRGRSAKLKYSHFLIKHPPRPNEASESGGMGTCLAQQQAGGMCWERDPERERERRIVIEFTAGPCNWSQSNYSALVERRKLRRPDTRGFWRKKAPYCAAVMHNAAPRCQILSRLWCAKRGPLLHNEAEAFQFAAKTLEKCGGQALAWRKVPPFSDTTRIIQTRRRPTE